MFDPELFPTFGELLVYLRKRARLTQDELGRAVGYSREHISRLEKNQRQPAVTTVAALFVPALGVQPGSELTARLLQLASSTNIETQSRPSPRSPRRRVLSDAPGKAGRRSVISAATKTAHLPTPLLPLVGRARELDAVRALLRKTSVHLLTLLGPPGVGKTRLALQAASQTSLDLRDGARFIELAAIHDPAQVAAGIRQALGVVEPISESADAEGKSLRDYLRDKQMLLVLDNFEQVLPAALLLADLLSAAPYLKIMVTSRAALQLYGEHEFHVPPLAVPDLAQLPALDALGEIPAVALFAERVRAIQPNFKLAAQNALAVATICVRLDGLPLALELAAAQIRLFTPQDLAARLVHRLSTLTRGARNLPPRQQTLRGALEWSYNLLESKDKQVFAQLGVFRGGFDQAAAEWVCPGADLLPLVESSLVQVRHPPSFDERQAGESRFIMLETIREFALEQLAAIGKEGHVRKRHAHYYLELAERAEPHLFTAEQKPWLKRLDVERDNFNAALEWLMSSEDRKSSRQRSRTRVTRFWRNEVSLRLCVALYKFWRYRGYLPEGYQWTRRALELEQSSQRRVSPRVRARALWGLGLLSALLRQEQEAAVRLEASLRLWEREEDARGIADTLTALGTLANERGEFERAIRLQRQALALYQEEGDLSGMKYAHNQLGESLRSGGLYETSREQYEASRRLSAQLGNPRAVAVAQINLAQTERARGNHAAAREHLSTSLAFFVEIGDSINIAIGLIQLASIALETNSKHRWRAAAQGLGFAQKLLRETGGTLWAADRIHYERVIETCRAALGEDLFETEQEKGQALTLEQALARVE